MKGTIRDKAIICVDMCMAVWSDDGTVFVVQPFTAHRHRLVAPDYGGTPYGCGALYVLTEDVIVEEESD